MAREAYIVCTGDRGTCVIFGYSGVEPVAGQPIVMENARMILQWDIPCGGLFGLAAGAIGGDTRITAAIPRTGMRTVTEWLAVPDPSHIESWPAYYGE